MWVFTNVMPYVRVTSNKIPAALASGYEYDSLNGFKPGLPALVNKIDFDAGSIQLTMRPRLAMMASPGLPQNRYVVRV